MARSTRSFWRMVERIQSPWIQPCGRPARDEDPPRLVALPFAFAVTFFARSKAAVLSFTIVAGEADIEQQRWDGGECSR